MSRRRSRGFSLVELLVSVAIFSMAVLTMAALTETSFKRQSSAFGQSTVHNGATMMSNMIRKACAAASLIQAPGAGSSADWLTVWENVTPDGSGAILDPAVGTGRTMRHLCLYDSGGISYFYLYEGTGLGWPGPAVTCGSGAPAGLSRTLLAGAVGGLSIAAPTGFPDIFIRPTNTQVQIRYTLTLARPGNPTITTTHATQINLEGALQ